MLKVNFNYIKFIQNKKTLLLNTNFVLNNNSIYTILGKNGSGKSTLLMAIIKMLDKGIFQIDGSVELENTPIYSLDELALKNFRTSNFRFVFQDPVSAFDPLRKIKYYFDLTSASEETIENELKYFQLPKYSEIKNLYPHEFSVGMLQRVNIILALISKPKILLLDEPTSALDSPIMNLLRHRLHEFVKIEKRIVLMVTQDIPFAKNTSHSIAQITNRKLSDFLSVDKYFMTDETKKNG